MASQSQAPDHWSPTAYNASASFVPTLTTTALQWLSPQPGDAILDIGCGDGQLTSRLKEAYRSPTLSHQISNTVVGLDFSAALITYAKH
ncbi:MAG: hypothetical protein Q9183_005362, partial [Haloplaca sp. 2 TL-2023]